jgi:hypothetical protein
MKELPLTEWQLMYKKSRTPKPSENLTPLQRRFFENAVKKIRFIPTSDGGLDIDYSNLTIEESFAIGVTGTSEWPLFTPAAVDEKVRAMRPCIGNLILPGDANAEQRLRELERHTIIGSLDEKATNELIVSSRNKDVAKRPRRTKPDTQLVEIKKIMRTQKRDQTLRDFLDAAENGSITKLSLKIFNNSSPVLYEFHVDEFPAPYRKSKRKTVEDWWGEINV